MINLYDLSPEVQRLAQLGSPGALGHAPWLKYESLGIKPEHIPDLIEVLERFDDFWEIGLARPQTWTPVHAWRALGQLKAAQALPAMAGLLVHLDEFDFSHIQEDLPKAIGMIGPPAIPVLLEYLLSQQHGLWVRAAAAESLKQVAESKPAARDEVADSLVRALEKHPANPPLLNGLLIRYLIDLKYASAAGPVEQAFTAGRVDLSVCGDWEDYQVAVGLLKERRTPRQSSFISPAAFRDGLSPQEEEHQQRSRQRIWLKRHKQNRKKAVETQKIKKRKKKK